MNSRITGLSTMKQLGRCGNYERAGLCVCEGRVGYVSSIRRSMQLTQRDEVRVLRMALIEEEEGWIAGRRIGPRRT